MLIYFLPLFVYTGPVSLSVFLVSLAVTVCAVWLVALCGVCGWCQRKLVSLHTHTYTQASLMEILYLPVTFVAILTCFNNQGALMNIVYCEFTRKKKTIELWRKHNMCKY